MLSICLPSVMTISPSGTSEMYLSKYGAYSVESGLVIFLLVLILKLYFHNDIACCDCNCFTRCSSEDFISGLSSRHRAKSDSASALRPSRDHNIPRLA